MSIHASQLRSALGKITVALSQIEGVQNSVCQNTAERWEEITSDLRSVQVILEEEAALVESRKTPTIKEWARDGGEIFHGTVPFAYPQP